MTGPTVSSHRLKQLPELEDVATDQQPGGLAVSLVIDRVTASRLGIAPSTIDNTLYDAFGQRQINTMYTQVNQYHVVLESRAAVSEGPQQAEPALHPVQCVFGRNRRGGFFLFRVFRILLRGIQCADDFRAVHSVGQYPGSSRERAFAERLRDAPAREPAPRAPPVRPRATPCR